MLYLIEQSTDLPVSLDTFKSHLDFTLSDKDTELTRLLRVAVDWCERMTGKCLVPALWEEHQRTFPCELQKSPVTDVSWVKYYDADNNLQTWDASNYVTLISQHNLPGKIFPLGTVPATYCRPDAWQVRYRAGYGITSSSSSDGDDGPTLPAFAAQAILTHATYFWEHPEGDIDQQTEAGLERLLRPLDYRGYLR